MVESAEERAMPKLTIETELQCQQVTERIAELVGCIEDTPEERELIELMLAYEIWETKRWKGSNGYPTD